MYLNYLSSTTSSPCDQFLSPSQEAKETHGSEGTEGTEGSEVTALGFQEDTTADPSKAEAVAEPPEEKGAAEPVKPIYLAGKGWGCEE